MPRIKERFALFTDRILLVPVLRKGGEPTTAEAWHTNQQTPSLKTSEKKATKEATVSNKNTEFTKIQLHTQKTGFYIGERERTYVPVRQ